MKKLIIIILLLIPLVYAYSNTLDYQGILKNTTTGEYLNGSIQFNITLYNQNTNAKIFSEQRNIYVLNGTWNFMLGEDSALTSALFKNNLYFQMMVADSLLPKTNFSWVAYAFHSNHSSDSDKLNGQLPSYYLDDTNTWNSTNDIWKAIGNNTFQTGSELDTWNTTDDIWKAIGNNTFSNTFNSTDDIWKAISNETWSSRILLIPTWIATNKTDIETELRGNIGSNVSSIKASAYTSTNFSVNYYGITSRYGSSNHSLETHAYIGNCSGKDCDIGIGNITGIQNSDNITWIPASRNFALNIEWSSICELVTGSADLCDGSDAVGGGGSGGTYIDKYSDNYMRFNTSKGATEDFDLNILNSSNLCVDSKCISQWSEVNLTGGTNTFNSTDDIWKAIGNNTFQTGSELFNSTNDIWKAIGNNTFNLWISLVPTWISTNRTAIMSELRININSNISNLKTQAIAWDTGNITFVNTRITDLNTSTSIRNLGFVSNAYNSALNITTYYGPHTNLSESNVEAFIFDNDNTANFNMSTYNISMRDCKIYTNSTPCIVQQCGSTKVAVCP